MGGERGEEGKRGEAVNGYPHFHHLSLFEWSIKVCWGFINLKTVSVTFTLLNEKFPWKKKNSITLFCGCSRWTDGEIQSYKSRSMKSFLHFQLHFFFFFFYSRSKSSSLKRRWDVFFSSSMHRGSHIKWLKACKKSCCDKKKPHFLPDLYHHTVCEGTMLNFPPCCRAACSFSQTFAAIY